MIWKSSNYALYGDMSRRMYEVLATLAPQVEPYSIDEMFLDFTGLDDAPIRAAEMRTAVLKIAKIPTCVGIGPTKSIAKLANAVAKKDRAGSGVCDLRDPDQRAVAYRDLAVGSVWGLGPASAAKLNKIGVQTIAEFITLPDDEVRKLLSVVGLRTCWELRGTSCMPLSLAPSTRKSLAVTRSFGKPIATWPEMEQAISAYAARAAEKLRRHGLVAAAMQVFLQTNRFSKIDRQYVNQASFAIEPSADTFAISQQRHTCSSPYLARRISARLACGCLEEPINVARALPRSHATSTDERAPRPAGKQGSRGRRDGGGLGTEIWESRVLAALDQNDLIGARFPSRSAL